MMIKSPADLNGLIKIGQIVGETLLHMAEQLQPGMTTADLDQIGAVYLAKRGAKSAPIHDYRFPAHTCISINDEAAHGIATAQRVIQAGDLVNIDVSAVYDGYYADTGASYPVPPVRPEVERLCQYTRRALVEALAVVRDGAPLNVVGRAVDDVAKAGGYSIIRDLGGHGIGRKLHEPPHSIPHFFRPSLKDKLVMGQVLTVEPFLCVGKGRVKTDADGWTLRTVDKTLAAQYEHTIIITEGQPILTTKVSGTGH
jgi:methionyl aminopeptidase